MSLVVLEMARLTRYPQGWRHVPQRSSVLTKQLPEHYRFLGKCDQAIGSITTTKLSSASASLLVEPIRRHMRLVFGM